MGNHKQELAQYITDYRDNGVKPLALAGGYKPYFS